MGGMTYSELAAWDKQGRKRSTVEQLNSVLQGILSGVGQNRKMNQEDLLLKAKMSEAGYTPQDQATKGKLGMILQSLAGGQSNYNYTGAPVTAKDIAETQLKQAQAGYYNRRDPNKSPSSDPLMDSIKDKIFKGEALTEPEKAYYRAFGGPTDLRDIPDQNENDYLFNGI